MEADAALTVLQAAKGVAQSLVKCAEVLREPRPSNGEQIRKRTIEDRLRNAEERLKFAEERLKRLKRLFEEIPEVEDAANVLANADTVRDAVVALEYLPGTSDAYREAEASFFDSAMGAPGGAHGPPPPKRSKANYTLRTL
jgi:hypothetical protein